MPSFSHTAASASVGVLPAPAPKRRALPSSLSGPGADRADRIGHAESEVLVPVKADSCLTADLGHECRDTIAHLLEDEGARGVDHVDALATGIDHDAALLGQHRGPHRVRHHKEADSLQAQIARQAEVLD